MILVFHVAIALLTVGISGFTLVKPTKNRLYSSYLLAIATFATGTYLIVISPAHLVPACIAGLGFLGVVGSMLFAANKRFVKIYNT